MRNTFGRRILLTMVMAALFCVGFSMEAMALSNCPVCGEKAAVSWLNAGAEYHTPKCALCGWEDPDYHASHFSDCDSPGVCSDCGAVGDFLVSHLIGDAFLVDENICRTQCSRCGEYEDNSHSNGCGDGLDVCIACGATDAYLPIIHDWSYHVTGKCLKCGAIDTDKCNHDEYTPVYVPLANPEYTYTPNNDGATHFCTAITHEKRCGNCNEYLSTSGTVSSHVPCTFENGVCTLCGGAQTACTHESTQWVSIGITCQKKCTSCGTVVDENQSHKYWCDGDMVCYCCGATTASTPGIFARYHKMSGITFAYVDSSSHTWTCGGCGHSESEAHTMVNGACQYCVAPSPECTHEDCTDVYDDQSGRPVIFSNKTATHHDYQTPYICTCDECGRVEEIYADPITVEHTYTNGVCACGAKEAPATATPTPTPTATPTPSPAPVVTPEPAEGEYCPVCKSKNYDDIYDGKKPNYRQNSDGKTHSAYYTANRTCLDCGKVFKKGLEIPVEGRQKEVHGFSVTPHVQYDAKYHWGTKTRKCADCGFDGYTDDIEKTEHSFGEISWEKYTYGDDDHERKGTAKCTVYGCGYVKEVEEYGPHNWENGACEICPYYCVDHHDDLDNRDHKCDTCGEWTGLLYVERKMLENYAPEYNAYFTNANDEELHQKIILFLGIVEQECEAILSLNPIDLYDATVGKYKDFDNFDKYSSEVVTEMLVEYIANYDVGQGLSGYSDAEVNGFLEVIDNIAPGITKGKNIAKIGDLIREVLTGKKPQYLLEKFGIASNKAASDAAGIGLNLLIETIEQQVTIYKARVVRARIEQGIGSIDVLPMDIRQNIDGLLDEMENGMATALEDETMSSLMGMSVRELLLKVPSAKITYYLSNLAISDINPDDFPVLYEKNLTISTLAAQSWDVFSAAADDYEENPTNENLQYMREAKFRYVAYACAAIQSYQDFYEGKLHSENAMNPFFSREAMEAEIKELEELCQNNHEKIDEILRAF